MKPVSSNGWIRLACQAAAASIALCAAVAAWSATAVKNPLYGDPAHPNISGMWNPEYAYFGPPIGDAPKPPPGPGGAGQGKPFVMPPPPPIPQLTPPYAKRYAQWRRKFETGEQDPDSVTRCLAFGLARFGTMPLEIIQTPGQVTMNLGVLHDIRRIYMDGIGHTTGADPSFNGDSVGHWEGDTLVVETNNVRAGTIDRDGVPYSDQLTAVERIRLVSPARMEIETTLTDPEAFVTPFVIKRAYTPMPPGSRFEEYLCENNRDL
ncbi:MAG: hypothetical protein ABI885_07270 [Gammaproteobacteria bacterium]